MDMVIAATTAVKGTRARCAWSRSGHGIGTAGPPCALQIYWRRAFSATLPTSSLNPTRPQTSSLSPSPLALSPPSLPLPLSLPHCATMGGSDLGGGETTGGWRRRFVHSEGDKISSVELSPLSTSEIEPPPPL
ncbi:Os10g0158166 [Oryza sativa Japonica Group]|uniref:Os10g0158166 protein n=1 Tax=Oryza sativa subsp. japonica TaxID=39947 RepID=A0A0P0XSJ3_ORYSJ|nr:Os10g0158166 [Oryza sativa Japonica Group]